MTSTTALQACPKIELHVHLDCSLTRNALIRLGRDPGDAAFHRTFTAPERCSSLLQYLRAIAPSCAVLQSAEALAIATEELILTLAADGVIHSEIRFAPHTHQAAGLSLDQVLEAVTSGLRAGMDATATTSGLILCALRDFPVAANASVINLAARWRDQGVVGVDLAGDEAGHPARPNRAAFDLAHEFGLNVTAHAGEAAGPASLIEVMDLLRPKRIGHGVRAIESDEVMDRIKEQDLHLEVCPSSNIQVGVYPDLAHHPIDALSRRGLSLSINTDARTVAPLSLTLEYQRLAKVWNWDDGEFLAHNLEAARHAFLPEKDRRELKDRLIAGWPAS